MAKGRARVLFWAFVAFATFTPTRTYAHGFDAPEQGVAVGPSVAYAHEPRVGSGLLYGVDAVYARGILWMGGGLRAFETLRSDERQFLPYVEAGLYLIVNVGAGYTYDLSGPDTKGWHLFLGLPLPARIDDKHAKVYFVEPYYRATYVDAGTLHEAGLLLKWSTWWWPQPDLGESKNSYPALHVRERRYQRKNGDERRK